jgi:hypothetical protein
MADGDREELKLEDATARPVTVADALAAAPAASNSPAAERLVPTRREVSTGVHGGEFLTPTKISARPVDGSSPAPQNTQKTATAAAAAETTKKPQERGASEQKTRTATVQEHAPRNSQKDSFGSGDDNGMMGLSLPSRQSHSLVGDGIAHPLLPAFLELQASSAYEPGLAINQQTEGLVCSVTQLLGSKPEGHWGISNATHRIPLSMSAESSPAPTRGREHDVVSLPLSASTMDYLTSKSQENADN